MNAERIYYAQLNVSKCYTVDTINNLISKLSYLGEDVYYNNETRSIDIDNPSDPNVKLHIINKLQEWVKDLPTDKDTIETICCNIDFIFNITTINIDNNTIIKVYLY